MAETSLETCIASIKREWDNSDTSMIANCCRHMAALAESCTAEPWLAEVHRSMPASQELYRDPGHGFVLQTHVEQEGVYRPPHDHGRSWVVYAVQHGEVEMGTYARFEEPDDKSKLVKRSAKVMRAGMAQIYLPGDIHDTFCLSGPAVLFRFTERDLREEANAGLMTRYVERNGRWMVAA